MCQCVLQKEWRSVSARAKADDSFTRLESSALLVGRLFSLVAVRFLREAALSSVLLRWWSGTADQVVVVDVNYFFGLISVGERNGPV